MGSVDEVPLVNHEGLDERRACIQAGLDVKVAHLHYYFD